MFSHHFSPTFTLRIVRLSGHLQVWQRKKWRFMEMYDQSSRWKYRCQICHGYVDTTGKNFIKVIKFINFDQFLFLNKKCKGFHLFFLHQLFLNFHNKAKDFIQASFKPVSFFDRGRCPFLHCVPFSLFFHSCSWLNISLNLSLSSYLQTWSSEIKILF